MTNFFDFREKQMRAGRRAKQEGAASKSSPASGEMLSVSQLTRMIEVSIQAGVPAKVLVHGELSNVNLHRASGHLYFTLKDSDCCIDCAMWRSEASRLKFEPADGMELLVGGRVGVYA